MTAWDPSSLRPIASPSNPTWRALSLPADVTITGRMESPADEVLLNAADLRIRAVTARQGAGPVPCAFTEHPQRQELSIRLGSRVEGPWRSRSACRRPPQRQDGGLLSQRLPGGQRPAARRRHPVRGERRATRLPLSGPSLTKSRLRHRDAHRPGAHGGGEHADRDRAARGPRPQARALCANTTMSTYLVFFAVGAFESLASADDPRVRALSVPGRIGEAGYGLAAGAAALRRLRARFRHALPAAQARPDRGAGLRFRRHGELGRHHLQGEPAPPFPGYHRRRGGAHMRGHRPRNRPPVVRQPGDPVGLDLPVVEREFRHLLRLRCGGPLPSRLAGVASVPPQRDGCGAGQGRASGDLPHRDPRRGPCGDQRQHGPDHLQQRRQHPAPGQGIHRAGRISGRPRWLPSSTATTALPAITSGRPWRKLPENRLPS